MVEAAGSVPATPVVRSKPRRSKSKSKSKPFHNESPASSSTAITASPRKWSLFHRGNGTPPSKKPITLFQSRRRRQKQQNQCQSQDSQSTDRELPINESKTAIRQRAGKKPNAKVPAGNTANGKEAVQPPVMEQAGTSQTDSHPMWQRDNGAPVNSSQRSWTAADTTTKTEQSDSVHFLQSSSSGSTPGLATHRTTSGKNEGSERAVLIFDREKRTHPSIETLQEKNVERNQSINLLKTTGAVVGIVILCWLTTYLPTKIVEGGQRIVSIYHNFTSRMQTLAQFLRIAFTVAAWAATMFGWGYLVKNTKKFIERRRSDLNPTLVNLNNTGTHMADLMDDSAPINHYEKRFRKPSFQGTVRVDDVTASATRHDDHASQIHVHHDHEI